MLWQKHKVEKFEAEEKKKVGVMQNGDMPLKKKKKIGNSPTNRGEGQRKAAGEQKEIGMRKNADSKSIDYRFTPCLESFPQVLQRCKMLQSPSPLEITPMGSISPWQRAFLSPGTSST